MEEYFNLKILSRTEVILNVDVERVILNGIDGEFTILKDFNNFIGLIKEGDVKVLKDGNEVLYNLGKGIVEFYDNKCKILIS